MIYRTLLFLKDDEVAKKEEDNAARVDALLMELFPGRADLFRNNKGGNKAIQPSSKKVLGYVAKGKVRKDIYIYIPKKTSS